ncbi:MAG TPA: 5-(carboxyamino)imidazole ribonucleotide synthase [Methylophilus sp.]|uniref:5-(carboxyamino)imidazole ribonucleotide synthase n=1 Tax=Methylophilus sp. TaxID=29541 RepID=UPI002C1459DA|nr:5-(carboxyamino)imidazole ribonucleotide synthase [Methylophilus sp.]HSH85985.1 5-(carboxyamino)imidazole ribonucleotide synthase [Methylophilus sp.]
MTSQPDMQNQSLHNANEFSVIQPAAMLGMLGGGQLGRFFVIAAHEMGYKVTVLDPDKNSPAGMIADVHLCAAYDDEAALKTMAETCAAISTEFENVPAETLATLAKSTIVHPSADAVAIAQHRIKEKTFFKEAGLPIGPFVAVTHESDLPEDGDMYPAVLKVARFGYDGKGQARVANQAEAKAAFQGFKQEVCVLEKMLALDLEVSVVLARDVHGNIAAFPTAENSHLNGILDVSIAPARCSEVIKANAQELAKKLATKLNYVGVLGVEFFVVGNQLLINEIAPRPHNSGHYTLDACITNQFEQQVRVITGQTLGNPNLHSNAVMVNILGDSWLYSGQQQEPAWNKAFAHGNLKMHLYGKHEPRKGRKMGHFTVIGEDAQAVLNAAKVARSELHIGE